MEIIGEELNGLKNRKCKEYYDNGIIKFVGEYLNGKKHGKGKVYNKDGNLIFEGEYLNGERDEGKEFYNNGELKFEGKYNKGIKWTGLGYNELEEVIYELDNGNGNVKEYNDNDKLVFEG